MTTPRSLAVQLSLPLVEAVLLQRFLMQIVPHLTRGQFTLEARLGRVDLVILGRITHRLDRALAVRRSEFVEVEKIISEATRVVKF